MNTTAIVILNYNNYNDTINCIESVLKYNTADIKFYVVDNASPNKECVPALDMYLQDKFRNNYLKLKDTDSTLEKYPKATFITSEINNGYASGNNKALRFITEDKEVEHVLILNNDILFIQDIIPALIAFLQSHSDAAIVSPLLLKKDGKSIDYNCARRNVSIVDIIFQTLKVCLRIPPTSAKHFFILRTNPEKIHDKSIEIELPSGSCMLISKSYFLKIGFFDPNTFLYYEENILFKKIHKDRKKNYLIPSLKCIHLGAQSTITSKKSYSNWLKSNSSTKYYVDEYSDSNILLKVIYHISFLLARFSIYLSSRIKKIFKL